MMIESIQNAVMHELERARGLPLIYREDARSAISHALACHLVDCMLRQGRAEATLQTGAYEVCIRPVAQSRAELPEAMLLYSGHSQASIDTIRESACEAA